MSESRWDRFVSKAIDVICLIGLGSIALIALGLMISGAHILFTRG